MSLYEGLDLDDHPGLVPTLPPEKKPDALKNPGWSSSSLKFLESQKHLQAKKAASLNSLKKKPPGTTLAPVINLRRKGGAATPGQSEGGVRFNPHTGKMEVPLGAGHSPFLASEAPMAFPGITDEYDPFHPNDYEEVVARRKEQRQKEREEERKREADERRMRKVDSDSDSDGEFEKRRRRREEREEREDDSDKPRRPGGGAAIAPPPSLIEDSDVKPVELLPVEIPPPPSLSDPSPGPGFSIVNESVASKIMARMGYKQGSGLGKSEQGMSTALQVEKTSKRGGKIIHEKDIPKASEIPRMEISNANLLKNPSKVILLRNMVGPGEVDDDLEPETAEECQKYGKVIKCVIFEIPGVCEEEAVRIFLQFERMEAAIKAVVDLNGRFFGGRAVKAGFYNVDKFRQLDLADPID